ncbi:transposase [Patescibacteria group bacterium]|nr:transposase [Patescibacteria group bacterium]MBU1911014.1 transposase [Patescibacteria group bacterium]
MPAVKPVPLHIRQKILSDLKEQGKSVPELAREHNISDKTIYRWLSDKGKGNSVPWREYQKLKRENEALKAIVGDLTLDISRTKKI